MELCNFCEGKLPYNTRDHAIWYEHELNMDVIKISSKGCPVYADCCRKDMNIESVFEIKYCPMCGRKLVSE